MSLIAHVRLQSFLVNKTYDPVYVFWFHICEPLPKLMIMDSELLQAINKKGPPLRTSLLLTVMAT